MRAVHVPMRPVPMIPMVLSFKSVPQSPVRSKFPRRVRSMDGMMLRVRARRSANACSATVLSPYAGTFETTMLWCVVASRSMWSNPVESVVMN